MLSLFYMAINNVYSLQMTMLRVFFLISELWPRLDSKEKVNPWSNSYYTETPHLC